MTHHILKIDHVAYQIIKENASNKFDGSPHGSLADKYVHF